MKPENILIEDEHAVIADFGVARALDGAGGEQITATGLAVGTPAYMSPEEASGSATVDGRADVYALGCVLYEMLAGGLPFVGTPKEVIAQRLHGSPVPVTKRRSGVPRSVGYAISKAMATRPEGRFKSAGEFADALETSLESGAWLKVAPWRLHWRGLVMTAVRSYELCQDAVRGIEQLATGGGDDCGHRRKKSRYLASCARDRKILRQECDARRQMGIEVDFLDERDLVQRFSFQRPAALLSQLAGEVDAYRLTHKLLGEAVSRGLEVYDRTVVSGARGPSHRGSSMQDQSMGPQQFRPPRALRFLKVTS